MCIYNYPLYIAKIYSHAIPKQPSLPVLEIVRQIQTLNAAVLRNQLHAQGLHHGAAQSLIEIYSVYMIR